VVEGARLESVCTETYRVRQNATQEHFGRGSEATAIRRIKSAEGIGAFEVRPVKRPNLATLSVTN
jgi:hypothetical protein